MKSNEKEEGEELVKGLTILLTVDKSVNTRI